MLTAPYSGGASVTIYVPNGPAVNFIIGRAGASINALQAETQTHIAVQKAAEVAPGAPTRVITITGATPEQCAHCANLVQNKVAEYHSTQAAQQHAPPPPAPLPLPHYPAEAAGPYVVPAALDALLSLSLIHI